MPFLESLKSCESLAAGRCAPSWAFVCLRVLRVDPTRRLARRRWPQERGSLSPSPPAPAKHEPTDGAEQGKEGEHGPDELHLPRVTVTRPDGAQREDGQEKEGKTN